MEETTLLHCCLPGAFCRSFPAHTSSPMPPVQQAAFGVAECHMWLTGTILIIILSVCQFHSWGK